MRPTLAPEDEALWTALGASKPRWTHWPTPGAPNELAAVRMAVSTLGQTLLPWQEWVVRILTEKRIDNPKRYRFPEFVLTVPRQAGKTTMVRGVLMARALLYPQRRAFYTAQTGKAANERWSELAEKVVHSPLGSAWTYKKGIGHERLIFDRTGSSISPFPPTATALHGYTPHDAVCDEIFAFDTFQGNDLMGAIKPAQQTLPDRQLIMLSTAGHDGSTFLREKVELGRASVDTGQDFIGYAEWSLPNEADPYDEKLWDFHPSLDYLIGVEDLRELSKSTSKGEWQRAFLNQWVEAEDPLFDMVAWKSLADEHLKPPRKSDCVFGFSQAADRSRAALVAAWKLPDGRSAVKLIMSTHDVASLPTTIAELFDEKPLAVCADNGAGDRELIDAVERKLPSYRRVTGLTTQEWMVASLGFRTAIADGTLVHGGDAVLTSAVANAQSKRMYESWAISHHSSPEVVAAAAAVRILQISKRKKLDVEAMSFGTMATSNDLP